MTRKKPSTEQDRTPVRRKAQASPVKRKASAKAPARKPAGKAPARKPAGKAPARKPAKQAPARKAAKAPARTARKATKQALARKATKQAPARKRRTPTEVKRARKVKRAHTRAWPTADRPQTKVKKRKRAKVKRRRTLNVHKKLQAKFLEQRQKAIAKGIIQKPTHARRKGTTVKKGIEKIRDRALEVKQFWNEFNEYELETRVRHAFEMLKLDFGPEEKPTYYGYFMLTMKTTNTNMLALGYRTDGKVTTRGVMKQAVKIAPYYTVEGAVLSFQKAYDAINTLIADSYEEDTYSTFFLEFVKVRAYIV